MLARGPTQHQAEDRSWRHSLDEPSTRAHLVGGAQLAAKHSRVELDGRE